MRLDRLRALDECRALLEPLDHQGLLAGAKPAPASSPDELDDDELLAQLGVEAAAPADITELRHVRVGSGEARGRGDRQSPEMRGLRQLQASVRAGAEGTRARACGRPAGSSASPKSRRASSTSSAARKPMSRRLEEPFTNEHGDIDARLRVIFDNGTESNLLMRSLQRALQQDAAGRRIIDPVAGPLFTDQNEEGDEASGIVYVLRSKSDHPAVAANRDVLHKIGVTGGDIARRIANARLDPTFLMADVEIVATYELYNINRTRLENLIHRIFGPARLDIEIKDRFGQPIVPREWFLVPLFAVDEAIERIREGTITGCIYDPKTARLTQAVVT